jgi:hypothetical protein
LIEGWILCNIEPAICNVNACINMTNLINMEWHG